MMTLNGRWHREVTPLCDMHKASYLMWVQEGHQAKHLTKYAICWWSIICIRIKYRKCPLTIHQCSHCSEPFLSNVILCNVRMRWGVTSQKVTGSAPARLFLWQLLRIRILLNVHKRSMDMPTQSVAKWRRTYSPAWYVVESTIIPPPRPTLQGICGVGRHVVRAHIMSVSCITNIIVVIYVIQQGVVAWSSAFFVEFQHTLWLMT